MSELRPEGLPDTNPLSPATAGNSSFSKINPSLQLAVDSTSLGEFKVCPRKYYYSIVCGLQAPEESPHLVFGIALHRARETYDKARTKGQDHEQALQKTVGDALAGTWNKALGRGWMSGHPNKNRLTLIRTIVGYLDELAQNDPLETLILASGQPAVELSFSLAFGTRTLTTDEPWVICGHMDRIAELNGLPYVVDVKSTERPLAPGYFAQFNPNNQFSLYDFAGRVLFGVETHGIIVDAIRVTATLNEFQRQIIPRDTSQIEEWVEDTRHWLGELESCAATGRWPMNDKNCMQYGRQCEFLPLCSRPQAARELWARGKYGKRIWDPLQARGEI